MNDQTRRKFLIRSVSALGAAIPLVYACEGGGGAGGGPLGPTGAGVFTAATAITVLPGSVTLTKGGTQTFTASGGTGPYNWSVGNTSLGSIGISTGAFTAGNTAGTLGVNAVDTLGASGSGAVTIIAPTIIVTPQSMTIPTSTLGADGAAVVSATNAFTHTFSASGGTAPYSYTISTSTVTTIVIGLTTGILSVTGWPAADETLTVTATDIYGDTGTTSLLFDV